MRGKHSKNGRGVGARSGVRQDRASADGGRGAGDPLPWAAVVSGMQSHILINSEHKELFSNGAFASTVAQSMGGRSSGVSGCRANLVVGRVTGCKRSDLWPEWMKTGPPDHPGGAKWDSVFISQSCQHKVLSSYPRPR